MNAVWDLHVCGRLEWGLLLSTLLLPQHHDKRERGGLLTDLCSDFPVLPTVQPLRIYSRRLICYMI